MQEEDWTLSIENRAEDSKDGVGEKALSVLFMDHAGWSPDIGACLQIVIPGDITINPHHFISSE